MSIYRRAVAGIRRSVSNTISLPDRRMPALQAKFWILTIRHYEFLPYLPPNAAYIKGQLELSADNYLHWQILLAFESKKTLHYVKLLFPTAHAEPTRSAAANNYVHKDETAVENTRFELGNLPLNRNSPKDWDLIVNHARSGEFSAIPGDVYVRCYTSLKKIRSDHLEPVGCVKKVFVFWGNTGTGKSRRAWDEAGLGAYPKDPNTKFWCGYRGHHHVILDEFRGRIDIAQLLRWLDRYPCIVEQKGSACVLEATTFWITSNLEPTLWYPDLDYQTYKALERRFTEVVHFP